MFGAPFGLGQWFVIRRRLNRTGWWVLATTLGFAVVFLLGALTFPQEGAVELSPAQQILVALVLGAAVALPPSSLQWLLVLRRKSMRARWWVVVSVVSWAICFAISFALRLAVVPLSAGDNYHP